MLIKISTTQKIERTKEVLPLFIDKNKRRICFNRNGSTDFKAILISSEIEDSGDASPDESTIFFFKEHCLDWNKLKKLLHTNTLVFIDYSGDISLIKTLCEAGALFLFSNEILESTSLQEKMLKVKQNNLGLIYEDESTDFVSVISDLRRMSEKDAERISTFNINKYLKLGVKFPDTYVYEIRDSVYINLTNSCTNNCVFCPRNENPVVKGHYLKIDRSPDPKDIIRELPDPNQYKEVVFCGYGEPTLCIDTIIEVAKYLKLKGVNTRLNTNGLLLCTNKKDRAIELKGLLDVISISLNFHNAELYNKYCQPAFGIKSFDSMLKFAKFSKEKIGCKVVLSVLDGYQDVDNEKCEKIADDLGVDFRLRTYFG